MIARSPEDNLDAEMDKFLEREFGNDSQSTKLPRFVWLFAAIPMALVLLGLYLTYAGGARVATAFQTGNWPSVSGTVTVCEVREYVEGGERMFSDEYTRYAADLVYQYTVKKTEFESGRIAIGESSVNGRVEAVQRLSPYSVGDAVTVFYDPKDPGKSCLAAGATSSAYMLLITGLFIVVITVRMSLSWLREFGLMGHSPSKKDAGVSSNE